MPFPRGGLCWYWQNHSGGPDLKRAQAKLYLPRVRYQFLVLYCLAFFVPVLV